MTPNFLQIHTLTGYSAALLNRDDVGQAKRLPFGGHDRIRVSSQCLKRHWREQDGEWAIGRLDTGVSRRSRGIFSDIIAPRLKDRGLSDPQILGVLEPIRSAVLGKSERGRAAEDGGPENADDAALPFAGLRTKQVIVLGDPEIAFLTDLAVELAKDDPAETGKAVESYFKDRKRKDNLKNLVRGAGIDAALFGRMVTSDHLARCDAAVHVAHSFTVHAEESEPDYFSAVDDLIKGEGELGSGHINTSELTSGLFYGYTVVDLRQLVRNLSRDRELAKEVLRRLIRLIATVSPGAKLGSTAPYACAELVLAEIGERQPRTLANAFMDPMGKKKPKREAMKAIHDYLERFDAMYGAHEERRAASMIDPLPVDGDKRVTLDELAEWAAGKVPEPAR